MPIHGTLMANDKKEHDGLHHLFMAGVLSSCWCTCRRCWDSQKVYGICFNDINTSGNFVRPMIVTDEDRRRYGTYRRIA